MQTLGQIAAETGISEESLKYAYFFEKGYGDFDEYHLDNGHVECEPIYPDWEAANVIWRVGHENIVDPRKQP